MGSRFQLLPGVAMPVCLRPRSGGVLTAPTSPCAGGERMFIFALSVRVRNPRDDPIALDGESLCLILVKVAKQGDSVSDAENVTQLHAHQ